MSHDDQDVSFSSLSNSTRKSGQTVRRSSTRVCKPSSSLNQEGIAIERFCALTASVTSQLVTRNMLVRPCDGFLRLQLLNIVPIAIL